MTPIVTPVVIALGSNLGDRAGHLAAAVRTLAQSTGLRLTAVSPVYETAPVGGPPQEQYLNAVVLADTDLPPPDLLGLLHRIEADRGRKRTERWGPRTLDLDLVQVAGVTGTEPPLMLPHPRAHERAFVLAPWADADPGAVLAGRGPVAALLAGLSTGEVSRRDDVDLEALVAATGRPQGGAR